MTREQAEAPEIIVTQDQRERALAAGRAIVHGQGDGTYDEATDAIHLLLAALGGSQPAPEQVGVRKEQERQWRVLLAEVLAIVDARGDSMIDALHEASTKAHAKLAALAQPEAARVGEVEGRDVQREVHWLLERRCTPPLYLTGRYSLGGQTDQADHAVRFSSKREAQEALRVMPSLPHERAEFFASEHMWIDGSRLAARVGDTLQSASGGGRLADIDRVARFLSLYDVWCKGWGLTENMNIAGEVAAEMAEIVRRWDFTVSISDDDDEAEMAITRIIQAERRAALQPAEASEEVRGLRAPGGDCSGKDQ